jgi:hypothetical protein
VVLTGLTGVGQWTRGLVFHCVLGSEGCVLVPRSTGSSVATCAWPTWVVSQRRVLVAVFILLEFPSPSRRIFIGSHSVPLSVSPYRSFRTLKPLCWSFMFCVQVSSLACMLSLILTPAITCKVCNNYSMISSCNSFSYSIHGDINIQITHIEHFQHLCLTVWFISFVLTSWC